MCSMVGDQLGGGTRKDLRKGEPPGECCVCGVHGDVCGWKVLGVWREGKTSGRRKRICKGPEA